MEIFSNTTDSEETVISSAEYVTVPSIPTTTGVRISGLIAEQAGISVHLDSIPMDSAQS